MRPLRLSIEGFGTFRDEVDVDFTSIDVVALVGATGAGKSTIIDAITFALYGGIARYDNNNAVAPAINQMSTQARVRLDFELADRTYTAVRVVQRTPQGGATTKEARLESGDEVLASEERPMTTRIKELLGLDFDQFNRTVVLPQGRFAGFLHDSPANRQKTMRQLLGFEIYNRIGQAARKQADEARIKIATIESEIGEGEGDLTAEHRAELQAGLDRVNAVTEQVRADSHRLAELTSHIEPLARRAALLSEQVRLLDQVRPPTEAGDLDDQLATAEARLAAALADRSQTHDAYQGAADAVAAGPDLAQCRLSLSKRQDAARLVEQLDVAIADAATAETALAAATTNAEAVTARQAALDAAVQSGQLAAQEARSAAAKTAHLAEINAWREKQLRCALLERDLTDAEHELSTAGAELTPLAAALADVVATGEKARDELDRARHIAGAASFVTALVVGEPCPVCRQRVDEIPAHDPSNELDRAQQEYDRLRASHATAKAEHDVAADRVRRAQAQRDARQSSLESSTKDVAGIADVAELDSLQAEAERLSAECATAESQLNAASAAAGSHRSDPATVVVLRALDEARESSIRLGVTEHGLSGQLERVQRELIDVPTEPELNAAIDTAHELAEAQRKADEHRRAVEQAADKEMADRDTVRDQHSNARSELLVVRERVSALDPPVLSGHELRANWDQLTTWAGAARLGIDENLHSVSADLEQTRSAAEAAERKVRNACETVLNDDVGKFDVVDLWAQLAARASELKAVIAALDKAIESLDRQRRHVAALREQAEVASLLAGLLRSDGFEAWLMESALANLADSASRRLRELSSGQFSLELDDRTFMVRDHSNADELRSAKTLSGGETFLASLALALALADATTELAAEGAPPIESIFLDEGFGTLDPATLDIVAAAIEELGADRMVGIVTHIRELADRMPVRLEVTKVGGTATIVRVEQ